MVAAILLIAAVASHPPGLLSRVHQQSRISSTVGIPSLGEASRSLISITTAHAETTPPVPRIINRAKTSQRLVALTFDLDMTPTMASEVQAGTSWFDVNALNYLRSEDIHATFFMTGMWAEIYPSIARQLAQDPSFEIGNHSFSHPAFHLPCYRLGGVSRAAQAQQVQMAQQAINWATGITPRYFRFPGGCYDREALDLVHAAGLIPIEWDVNSIDAFNSHAAQISNVVLSQVTRGSIVIMHLQAGANAPATGAALRMIVPALEQRGYQFVTVSELLAAGSPVQPTNPKEVVEVYQAPPPTPIPPRVVVKRVWPTPVPTPRWCGWVATRTGRVWVCRY